MTPLIIAVLEGRFQAIVVVDLGSNQYMHPLLIPGGCRATIRTVPLN